MIVWGMRILLNTFSIIGLVYASKMGSLTKYLRKAEKILRWSSWTSMLRRMKCIFLNLTWAD